MNKVISLKQKNRVGYIVMNKPKANSYDIDFMKLMAQTIDKAIEDDKIKVIAIKSKLDKFFCTGADVKVFRQNTMEENKQMVKYANLVAERLFNSPKITVALLNGHTLGGGLELALACDIRLSSDAEYLIGMSEVKLGLMPGNGGTQRLIRRINLSRALEFLLSGDAITSDQAFDIGLVNQFYPEQEFKALATAYLEKLASGPALAMAAIKQAVRLGSEMSLKDGLRLESKLANSLYETEDAKEGFDAFLEKRKPIFK
ncbi:enoyl-CoA hydratase/isomerase family protein [Namhaeicola litoreus]|uniref:Enoyl-CoA hydratase/isomerase family protein n=1 Tax=Namhaeicola litoreus TaxID=1052145 RepID=A0ABW3Y019_9FLAO